VRPRRPTTSAFAAAASNTLVRGLIPSHRRREFAGRIVTAVSLAAGLASVSLLAGGIDASAANAKAQPTVIATSSGAFGTMLVVGSGKYAGYTLYYITSDQPGTLAAPQRRSTAEEAVRDPAPVPPMTTMPNGPPSRRRGRRWQGRG
jgi:hypothetical protein